MEEREVDLEFTTEELLVIYIMSKNLHKILPTLIAEKGDDGPYDQSLMDCAANIRDKTAFIVEELGLGG